MAAAVAFYPAATLRCPFLRGELPLVGCTGPAPDVVKVAAPQPGKCIHTHRLGVTFSCDGSEKGTCSPPLMLL